MKRNILLLTVLSIAILITSCMSRKKTHSTALTNTAWQLAHAGRLTYDPKPGTRIISMQLSDDKKVTGFLGCNNLIGSYELAKGDRIAFMTGSTQMFCQGDGMKFEDAFSKALGSARKYKVEGERLFLFQENGELVADFKIMDK